MTAVLPVVFVPCPWTTVILDRIQRQRTAADSKAQQTTTTRTLIELQRGEAGWAWPARTPVPNSNPMPLSARLALVWLRPLFLFYDLSLHLSQSKFFNEDATQFFYRGFLVCTNGADLSRCIS